MYVMNCNAILGFALLLTSPLPSAETLVDDPVLAQYTNLPFPSVPEEKLRVEQSYYGEGKPWWNRKCNINHCDKSKNETEPGGCVCPPIFQENYLSFPNNLHNINHFLARGKQTFNKDFRVLMAGGGTGSNTIYLAEQLNHTQSEIVYIDLSPKSMAIAKKRAAIRGLKNIRFYNDKIENIPKLDLGLFDFIETTGVLHHLEDPLLGLRTLSSSLKADGGLSIFVYSTNTRIMVYLMQDLMRLIKDEDDGIYDEIKNTRDILDILPEVPIGQLPNMREIYFQHTDENLYDIFLHKRDTSFTMEQLLKWINKAGLEFVDFSNPSTTWAVKQVVDPLHESSELAEFRRLMNGLNREEKLVVGELSLRLGNHQFYAAKTQGTIASTADESLCPYFPFQLQGLGEVVGSYLAGETINLDNLYLVQSLEFNTNNWVQSTRFSFPPKPIVKKFLKRISTKPDKSIGEILTEIEAQTGKPREQIKKEFEEFYRHFDHLILLSSKGSLISSRSHLDNVFNLKFNK